MKKYLIIVGLPLCLFAVALLSSCTAGGVESYTTSIEEPNITTEDELLAEDDIEPYTASVAVEPPHITTEIEPWAEDEIIAKSISGDFIVYDSIYDLSEVATDVIRGIVLDSRVERIDVSLSLAQSKYNLIRSLGGRELSDERIAYLFPEYLGEGRWADYERQAHYWVVTIHRIKILEVFQSRYYHQVGDIIEIRQRGGEYGNMAVGYSGFIPFETGNDLVIFFSCGSPFGHPGILPNPEQSVYLFPASEGRSSTLSLDEELESAVESLFDLNLTLNDLLQLSSPDEFTFARNGEWEPTYAPPTQRQEPLVTQFSYEDLLELEYFFEMMQQAPPTPPPPTPVPTIPPSPAPGATSIPFVSTPSPGN